VKYLGSSCQQEVCEGTCPGPHQFYRARILPPRALLDPDPTASHASDTAAAADLAASLVQAQAATSGRPVLLILDLHPRLRCRSLEGLMQLPTAEQLQVGRTGRLQRRQHKSLQSPCPAAVWLVLS
jgi:hypothetical protein